MKMKPSRNLKPSRDSEREEAETQKPEANNDIKASQTCIICEMHFTYNSDYLRHMRIHTGEKPYTCSACSRQFSRQSNLNVHMLTHNCDNFHACSMCDAKFRHISSWKRHMRLHVGTKPYLCEHCSRQFYSKHKLTCHLMAHKGRRKNGRWKVPLASGLNIKDRTGAKNSYLQDGLEEAEMQFSDVWRLLVKHGVRRSSGVESPLRLEKSNRNKDVSIRGHTEVRTRQKQNSGLHIVDEAESKVEQRLLPEVEKVDIPSYDETVSSTSSNEETCRFNRTELFCHDCKQYFMRKNDLDRHRWTHTGEKPYMCEQCSRTFARQSNLKVHMFTHNPEKRFTCDLCELKFVHGNSFRRHMRIHRGEKLYMCERCSQQFYTRDKLKCHSCYL